MSNFTPQAGNTTLKEKPMKKKGPTVTVNAELMWAELTRKNAMSGKFQVVLTQLSEEAVAALIGKLNLKDRIQYKDERGNFMTVKSSFEIPAYDSDGGEIHELIGNGSQATVTLGSYDWDYNGKKGTSPSIVKLEVTKLIPYVRESEDAEVF